MRLTGRKALAIALALALAPVSVSGYADGVKDHDRARQALLSGEVLSLREVLERIGREYPGYPVGIAFDDDEGRYVYKIKLLQPAGSILKMKVDAATGQVIGVKGRGIERRGND